MTTVCRFVVQSADGRRSAEWRVWTGKENGRPGNDIYLAPSTQVADHKVSLHPASGHGQHGLSDAARKDVRPGDKHAIDRWELSTKEVHPGWSIWYLLQFPESQMADLPLRSPSLHTVVPAAATGKALLILVMVGKPGAESPADQDEFVIASLDRANGGRVDLVRIEVEFDARLLSDAENGQAGWIPWEVTGLTAQPEPFGWLVDIGNEGARRCTEFFGLAGADGRLAEFVLPDFPGLVRPWVDKPPEVNDKGLTCAVLVVPAKGKPELFIDPRSRCDHLHLSADATALAAAAKNGNLDHGWTRLDRSTVATCISTERVLTELGGLDEDAWVRDVPLTRGSAPGPSGFRTRLTGRFLRTFPLRRRRRR